MARAKLTGALSLWAHPRLKRRRRRPQYLSNAHNNAALCLHNTRRDGHPTAGAGPCASNFTPDATHNPFRHSATRRAPPSVRPCPSSRSPTPCGSADFFAQAYRAGPCALWVRPPLRETWSRALMPSQARSRRSWSRPATRGLPLQPALCPVWDGACIDVRLVVVPPLTLLPQVVPASLALLRPPPGLFFARLVVSFTLRFSWLFSDIFYLFFSEGGMGYLGGDGG